MFGHDNSGAPTHPTQKSVSACNFFLLFGHLSLLVIYSFHLSQDILNPADASFNKAMNCYQLPGPPFNNRPCAVTSWGVYWGGGRFLPSGSITKCIAI